MRRRRAYVWEVPGPDGPGLSGEVVDLLAEADGIGDDREALQVRKRAARLTFAAAGVDPSPLDLLRWARKARLGRG